MFKIGQRLLSLVQIEAAVNCAAAVTVAYDNAKVSGGSVEWSDVDLAHEYAKTALNKPRAPRLTASDRSLLQMQQELEAFLHAGQEVDLAAGGHRA